MHLAPSVCDDLSALAPLSEAVLNPVACGRCNKKSRGVLGLCRNRWSDDENRSQKNTSPHCLHIVADRFRVGLFLTQNTERLTICRQDVLSFCGCRVLLPAGENQLAQRFAASRSPLVTLPVVGKIGIRHACSE